jgi:hypothetical protein
MENFIADGVRPLSIYGKYLCENSHPETHTKRQATQHDCLPCLLGNGDKWIEILCTVTKKILYTRLIRAANAGQKSLVPAGQAQ